MENILVYQMGRVGSTAVFEALRKRKLTVRKIHYMYTNGEYKKATGNFVDTIKKSSGIFNVVSLVRNPLTRNLSAVMNKTYLAKNPAYEEVLEDYLHKYNHQWPLIWFDLELNKVFDIDIYSWHFNTEEGYSVYRYGKLNLLVIQNEKINHVARKAFKEWYSLSNFSVPPFNQTVGKRLDYANYIKAHAVFSPQFLDTVYNSKYVQHFYSKEDIAKMRKNPLL